jgi:dUTP pyrophosphatase
MVLNKKDIQAHITKLPPLIEQLTDPKTQIQPNGVDLTLDKIYSFEGSGKIDFSNENRQLPNKIHLPFNRDGYVKLVPGAYGVSFKEIVNMPDHIMALGRPRSSLIRMGASVVTAVWDAGYRGRSEAMLSVYHHEGVTIFENARLLQLVFFQLSGKTVAYDGIYQGENTD